METLSVGGLASGLDTNAIIDGLSNLEEIKVRREESKKENIEKKRDAFNDLVTRIGNLATKADALDEKNSFNIFVAESNDDKIVTLTGSEDALPGEFEVEVTQLATSNKVGSGGFASYVTGLGFTGSFEISRSDAAIENDPTKTYSSVDITATDSLKDVVRKINAAEGIGVNASIMSFSDTEHRIVLTAKDEGSKGFHMRELTGTPLGSSGLSFISDTQKARSEFNFVSTSGGALNALSTFDQMVTGIGANNLTSGDIIRIDGTDAQGNTVTTTDFSFDPATNTIQDLMTAVETAFGNVSAALNNSGEIVLTDTSTGTSELSLSLSFVDNDSSGSTMNLGTSAVQNSFNAVLSEGRRSFFNIDGLSVSAQSNSDDNIVRGTKINLHKADIGNTIKVSIKRNYAGIKDNIQGFIDQYNSVLKFIDDKSRVSFDEESKDGKKKVTSRGPFASDSTIQRIRNELQRVMTSQINELDSRTVYSSLSRVGITSNKSNGQLEVDSEKLEKAMTTDFDGVRALFMASGFSPDNPAYEFGRHTKDTKTGTYDIDTGTDEFDSDKSSTASNMLSGVRTGDILRSDNGDSKGLSITAPLGSGSGKFIFTRGIASLIKLFDEEANDYANGLFKNTKTAFEKRIDEVEERILKVSDQVSAFRARLVRQFADLEQSMARLQSQSSAFMSQMSAL